MEYLDLQALIVDVRTPDEYTAGHVPGSMNVPLQELDKKIVQTGDGNRAVIVCCNTGGRSKQAAALLKKEGFECINAGSWRRLKKMIPPEMMFNA